MVRLLPDQAARLDKWRRERTDGLGRPEAIRRLLEQALPSPPDVGSRRDAAHRASELASKTIEGLTDKSWPASEKARAKRRLVHGPKEFRDIRGDQPRRRK